MKNEKQIIEAAMFASDRSIDIGQLSELIGEPVDETTLIMNKLVEEYGMRESGFEIIKSSDTKYLMRVRPEYVEYVKSFAPKELPAPVLRTLSMIAYHQPVKQSDIVRIRGNSTYSHIHTLNEMGLIASTPEGHTKLLTTTPGFAEYFGLDSNNPDAIRTALKARLASRIGVTPMYESLLHRYGVPCVTVNAYNPSAEDLAVLTDVHTLIISKGYSDKVKKHFAGGIIEIASTTFDDLLQSTEPLGRHGTKRDVSKVISELNELNEKYHERSRKMDAELDIKVKPASEMASHILNDLGFTISQTGVTVASDGLDTDGADCITFPTHSNASADVIERICARYDAILEGLQNRCPRR
ncbi:MAG: SMC-Scp complex subunit ScpB [Euryarchaeota archaeon]|nr:SMC-Scp complex subunit ScpB [Euryarchaeota archaeon]